MPQIEERKDAFRPTLPVINIDRPNSILNLLVASERRNVYSPPRAYGPAPEDGTLRSPGALETNPPLSEL